MYPYPLVPILATAVLVTAFLVFSWVLWQPLAPKSRADRKLAQRPDYFKIALLEYELFGIEPKPGTAAAAAINIQRAAAQLRRAD